METCVGARGSEDHQPIIFKLWGGSKMIHSTQLHSGRTKHGSVQLIILLLSYQLYEDLIPYSFAYSFIAWSRFGLSHTAQHQVRQHLKWFLFFLCVFSQFLKLCLRFDRLKSKYLLRLSACQHPGTDEEILTTVPESVELVVRRGIQKSTTMYVQGCWEREICFCLSVGQYCIATFVP